MQMGADIRSISSILPLDIAPQKTGKQISTLRCIVAATACAFFVRSLFIYRPSSVVFDELNTGRQIEHYFRRTFFFDQSPPFGALLLTAIARATGYRGVFTFSHVGTEYLGGSFPYVALRAACALFGAAQVAVFAIILHTLGISRLASMVGCSMLIFENGFVLQSRVFGPESLALLLSTASVATWIALRNRARTVAAGVCLGLAASTRGVGLASGALISVLILTERQSAIQKLVRLCVLGCAATSVYVGLYVIHMAVANRSSDSLVFFSPMFAEAFDGQTKSTSDTMRFGSEVTLRFERPRIGFVHSHDAFYPTGSKQQQVTAYPFEDENNVWIARVSQRASNAESPNKYDEEVRCGDIVRFEHKRTGRFLHSHDVEPHVSDRENHKEVTCYGHGPSNVTDWNDSWIVRCVDGWGREASRRDKSVVVPQRTRVHLVHAARGCRLQSAGLRLPTWGFGQNELTCSHTSKLTNSNMFLQSSRHRLDGPVKISYKPKGTLRRFVEMQQVMLNNTFASENEHPFGSGPLAWLKMETPVPYWREEDSMPGSGVIKNGQRIVFKGNEFVWAAGIAALALSVLVVASGVVVQKRYDTSKLGLPGVFGGAAGGSIMGAMQTLLIGWTVHMAYFAAFPNGTFLFHYMHAYFYAIALAAVCVEAAMRAIPLASIPIGCVVAATAMARFVKTAPLTYGIH